MVMVPGISSIIILILYVLIFIVGVFGNLMIVFYFIYREKYIASNYRLFIIYLAGNDFGVCLVTPVSFVLLILMNNFLNFNEYICKGFFIVSTAISISAVWILCGLTYVRYLSITNPLKSNSIQPKYIHSYCLLSAVTPYPLAYIYISGFKVANNQCWTFKLNNTNYAEIYSYIFFTVCAIIPMTAVLIFIYKVKKSLQENVKDFNRTEKSSKLRRHRQNNTSTAYKKSERSLNVAFIVYCLLVFPFSITNIIFVLILTKHKDIHTNFLNTIFPIMGWSFLLFVSKSIVNCCAYAGRNTKFQQYLKEKVPCRMFKKEDH